MQLLIISVLPLCAAGLAHPSSSLRLLGAQRSSNAETFFVEFESSDGQWAEATLTQLGETADWMLHAPDAASLRLDGLGSPDDLYARGGAGASADFAERVRGAAPLWPDAVLRRLSGPRRLCGDGVVAFDAAWFLRQLGTSTFDRPMLLPDATAKLGLESLEVASELLQRVAVTCGRVDGSSNAFAEVLMRAEQADRSVAASNGTPSPAWAGAGRLVGEYLSGELAQIGADVCDGAREAIGHREVVARFEPGAPLGLSLGPVIPPSDDDSVGYGAEVGDVDDGGAADLAGVTEGMVFARLVKPDVRLVGMKHETILDEIDRRRAAGDVLVVAFETAAPIERLYAVEMPAAAALRALASSEGVQPDRLSDDDLDVGAALSAMLAGEPPLWREPTSRLFLGDASSLTCAHVDIVPQIEMAHGLCGIKILGIGSHEETESLLGRHGASGFDGEKVDVDASRVPTERALKPHEAELLLDEGVTKVALGAGDLLAFSSGAIHFASNGNAGLCGAVYHGLVTRAVVPRIRAAVAFDAGRVGGGHGGGRYDEHYSAAGLLAEIGAAGAAVTK